MNPMKSSLNLKYNIPKITAEYVDGRLKLVRKHIFDMDSSNINKKSESNTKGTDVFLRESQGNRAKTNKD